MNILGRDKSFYGQYKFLTSHSIFIVSSNIYRYHSCYVPRRCIVVALLLRPRLWFLYALYIIHIFFFLLLSLLPPSCREKFKHVFQTRLNVSRRSPLAIHEYRKDFIQRRRRRRGKEEEKEKHRSIPLSSSLKESERNFAKAKESYDALIRASNWNGDKNGGRQQQRRRRRRRRTKINIPGNGRGHCVFYT